MTIVETASPDLTPQDVAEAALDAACRHGVELVVVVEELGHAFVRWADQVVTASGTSTDRRTTVIALGVGDPGVVTAQGELSPAAAAQLVSAAVQARGAAPPHRAPCPRLPTGDDGDWAEPPGADPLPAVAAFAGRLAPQLRSASAAGHRLYGYAEQRTSTTYLAGPGLRRRHADSAALLDHGVHGEAGATTWSGAHAATLGGTDLDVAYAAARDRLRWWRRRVRLPAGDYEVLLSPSCTADLMLRLYRAAGARAALDGRTAFAAPGGTRLGERLTAAPVTLFSDPAAPGLRCAPFVVARGGGELSVYDNGLPLSRTHWITGGVLTALAGSRHTAAGDATTDDTTRDRATAAPEIGNLVLRSDAEAPPSIADMVSGTRRGLLVTSLWYLREVDPRRLLLTGFTRDGVYLIEDGMIRGAAGDFRFNTSPLDVLARIREVGRTELALPREYGEHAVRAAMPWLRVENFTLSEAAGA